MCWKGKYLPKIAKKDIPIYKIMIRGGYGDFYLSYYQKFPYTLNAKISEEIKTPFMIDSYKGKISKALHSYSKEYTKIESSFNGFCVRSREKELDYYSYILAPGMLAIVSGYIPKGATYCMNENGEYISNELILTHEE